MSNNLLKILKVLISKQGLESHRDSGMYQRPE